MLWLAVLIFCIGEYFMSATLKRLAADPDVVDLQNLLSANGYFKELPPPHGLFELITEQSVLLFQMQHIDKSDMPLQADGVVGDKTWWALKNASGIAQQNHFKSFIPKGLTSKRTQLLEVIIEEHNKPVFEVPNGANRSPDIENYWGNTGVIGLP